MTGWLGLIGTFLPVFVTLVCAGGPFRGRSLWGFSLVLHIASWLCFFLLAVAFYSGHLPDAGIISSPTVLVGTPWSGDMALSWNLPAVLLSLAACSVIVCFHFMGRQLIEQSRASLAGLSSYLTCLLGALGADHLLLFVVFLAGSILPRIAFTGVDSRDENIKAVKETAFLSVIAAIALLLCVLAFSDPFRGQLDQWFLLEFSGSRMVVKPGSIGFALMLLAAGLCAGIFPFHGLVRRVFDLARMERAVPLCLAPLFGFSLLFRFGLPSFPEEFHTFGPLLLGLFALAIPYCAIGFLGAKSARDRIFWLQQIACAFIAMGYFTLSSRGWHGAILLLLFQTISVPFFLLVLTCHERRPGGLQIGAVGKMPAFALCTALAVLFSLFLPVSIGFYGVLFVIWSLDAGAFWPLPFVILSIPLLSFAGLRLMFFRLGAGEKLAATGASSAYEDLHREEILAILPLGLALLILGLIPKLVVGPLGSSVSSALSAFGVGN